MLMTPRLILPLMPSRRLFMPRAAGRHAFYMTTLRDAIFTAARRDTLGQQVCVGVDIYVPPGRRNNFSLLAIFLIMR